MSSALQLTALLIFIVVYVLLFVFQKYRAYIAIFGAIIFIILTILPYYRILVGINWNVLLIIAGTMGTVSLFIDSKMPNKIADIIISKSKNAMWMVFMLSLFAGIISAFVDNVATVLMIAPVALVMCKKLNISPVPSLVAIAVSSNLQGAATLVGDTTSVLMAGEAGMNFLDFFFMKGRLGMFFVTEIGAVVSLLVLLLLFRKDKQPIASIEKTVVTDYLPSIALIMTVVMLIISSVFDWHIYLNPSATIAVEKLDVINGVICVAVFIVALIYECIKNHSWTVCKKAFTDIDYFTLLLLLGLFLLIAGIKEAGWIDRVSLFIQRMGGGSVFAVYTIIVWVSVICSAFIDNIPYVTTMLPVCTGLAVAFESAGTPVNPELLYFGLLVGATLGGNLTPIGASANIAAIGILRKDGYEVKNKDFFKIGIPFTLAAVITGYLLVWFIWG
ncbi:MAG: SLC13 family permease [Clostridia bacterium]|nr:SLC13 family permease [Clostridia bacterium]